MGTRSRGRRALSATMPLGDFLVTYLNRLGVDHIFGLPGDLVLALFHRFGRDRGLEIVTFSHEPSVGFAADGYARSTRRVGVLCVTYGAGGHNVLNPVAGAYAEQVPLLVVSGGPGEAEQKLGGIHHQAKRIESQWAMFREVTCDARWIRDPNTAAEEIHAVVHRVMDEHRPGYLEIHRDLVEVPIPVPPEIRRWNGRFSRPASDKHRLEEAVRDTVDRLRSAVKPVLVGGLELFRERAEDEFLALAEKLGAPVVTTLDAKGIFPMDHPLHMGIHVGPFSHPEIGRRVRNADLALVLGAQPTDMNLGGSRSQIATERAVWASSNRVAISYHEYRDVMLRDFVHALSTAKLPRFREKVRYFDNLKRSKTDNPSKSLSVNDLLVEVNGFLAEHGGYHVVAESGDMLFGGLELRLQGGGLYFAQGYYASMGFAVPAAMGVQIGTGVRPLVVMGDGAFQMTGPEISHAPAKGLSPIVVLVNNAGWGIFRPVSPRHDLLEVPPWPYADLAQAWGGVGFRVQTRGELRHALLAAHEIKDFVLIECNVPQDSLSPITQRYIRKSASRSKVS